jgi:hypothetical protein
VNYRPETLLFEGLCWSDPTIPPKKTSCSLGYITHESSQEIRRGLSVLITDPK